MKKTAWIWLVFLLLIAASCIGYFEVLGVDEVMSPTPTVTDLPIPTTTFAPQALPTLVPATTEVPK